VGAVDRPVGYLGGQVHQGVVRRSGLGEQGVHGNGPQPPIYQGPADGQVVHQLPPGGVDQNGSPLDVGQQDVVHQVTGLVVHRAVEGEDVAPGGQLLQGEVG